MQSRDENKEMHDAVANKKKSVAMTRQAAISLNSPNLYY